MLRGGGNVVYPQFRGSIPVFVHALGVGLGAVDPMVMAGRFDQIGPVQTARIAFDFTAIRTSSN